MANDYVDQFRPGQSGSRDNTRSGPSSETRAGRQIVGGYAYQPPNTDLTGHGSMGSYGPGTAPSFVFDPYRQNDLHRILSNQVNQGGIADLQLALVQAGLLQQTDISFGYLDDGTQAAFSTILSIANQQGMQWQDVLSQALAQGDNALGGAVGNGGPNPDDILPQVVLPNRDELRQGIDETVYKRAGVRYDDAMLDKLTDDAMDHARDLQLQEFNQRHAGERQEGRSLESFVENAIEEANPEAVMSHDVAEKAASWFAAIRSPV